MSKSTTNEGVESSGRSSNISTLSYIASLLIITLVYFGIPCYRYLTDGLIAAKNIRDSEGWFVHAIHPLYPLLPQVIHRILGRPPELELLVVWSLSMGLLSCICMLIIFRAGKMSTAATVAGLGLFAFLYGIWHYFVIPGPSSSAIGPQILTLAAIALIMKQDRPRFKTIILLSLLISFVTLSSQINMGLLLPAGYALYTRSRDLKSGLVTLVYFLVTFVLIYLSTLILISVCLVGVRTPIDFIKWQHSYPYDERYWAHSVGDAAKRVWFGSVNALVPYSFKADGLFGTWSEQFGTTAFYKRLPLCIGQAIVLLFFTVETIRAVVRWIRTRSLHPLQVIGVLVAMPIILFHCFFSPDGPQYRIMYLPGQVMFMIPSLEHHYQLQNFKLRKAWPVLLVILTLFGVGYFYHFRPLSDPLNNRFYSEVKILEEEIGPGDLVILSGTGNSNMRMRYLEYFVECQVIRAHELLPVIRNHPDDVMNGFIEMYESGSRLFIHENALYSEEDVEWMNEKLGMDVKPDELLEYMDSRMVPIRKISIREKFYIEFRPVHPDESLP